MFDNVVKFLNSSSNLRSTDSDAVMTALVDNFDLDVESVSDTHDSYQLSKDTGTDLLDGWIYFDGKQWINAPQSLIDKCQSLIETKTDTSLSLKVDDVKELLCIAKVEGYFDDFRRWLLVSHLTSSVREVVKTYLV